MVSAYTVKPFPKRLLKNSTISYWTLDNVIDIGDMLGGPVPDYRFPKFNSKYCFTPKIKFAPLQPTINDDGSTNIHLNEPSRTNPFHHVLFNTIAFVRGNEYIIFYPTAALKAGLMIRDEEWIKNNLYYNNEGLFYKVKEAAVGRGDKRLFCEAARSGKWCDNAGSLEISSKSQMIAKPKIVMKPAAGNPVQKVGLKIRQGIKKHQVSKIIKQYAGDKVDLTLDDETYLDDILKNIEQLNKKGYDCLTSEIEAKLDGSKAMSWVVDLFPYLWQVMIKQPMKYFHNKTRIPGTHQLVCSCPIGMNSFIKEEFKKMTIVDHHAMIAIHYIYAGDICIGISIGGNPVDSLPGISRVLGPLVDLNDPFVQDVASTMTTMTYLPAGEYPGNLEVAQSEQLNLSEIDSYGLQFYKKILDPELNDDIEANLLTVQESKEFTAREFGLFSVEDKFMRALKLLHANELKGNDDESEAYFYNRLRDPAFTRGDPSVYSVDAASVTNPLVMARPDDFTVIIGWPYKNNKLSNPLMGRQYTPKKPLSSS